MTQRHRSLLRMTEVGLMIAIVGLLIATWLPAILAARSNP